MNVLEPQSLMRFIDHIFRLNFRSAGKFLFQFGDIGAVAVIFFDSFQRIDQIVSGHEFNLGGDEGMDIVLEPFCG